jgi:hypothetical protein
MNIAGNTVQTPQMNAESITIPELFHQYSNSQDHNPAFFEEFGTRILRSPLFVAKAGLPGKELCVDYFATCKG